MYRDSPHSNDVMGAEGRIGDGPGGGGRDVSEHTLTWRAFHEEWTHLQSELRQRDRDHMDMLTEIRDSLGDMHTRLEALGCTGHMKEIAEVKAVVACLNQNSIPWRRVLRLVNGKSLAARVGLGRGLLGWDGAAKILSTWAGK